MMRLEDFVDGRALEALYRPMDQARGLPASVYTEAFYQLENRYLFPRTWSAVAVGSQIPSEGDVLPVVLGDWPILLVRGLGSEIKAYLNICRHRGMRLVTGLKRHCEAIKCPWHSWTYDLEGRLISAPNYSGWTKDGIRELEAKKIELKKLPVAVWRDLIFVNIDGNAPPFEEHCKPIEALLREYRLDDLRYGGNREHVYEGNWKVSVEGAIEGYHTPWGHPQACDGVTGWKEQIRTHETCYAATDSWFAFGGENSDASSVFGSGLPSLAKFSPNGQSRILLGNIFPTEIFVACLDHFLHVLLLPDGWNRTKLSFHFYYGGDAAQRRELAATRQSIEDQWLTIAGQDDGFVSNVQANMLARDQAGITPQFAPYWEGAAHHFQKMVVGTIQQEQSANI